MNTDTPPGPAPGRLVELSDEESWELLAGTGVGRLVWSGSEGLTAIPVNHAVVDGTIQVRTAAYSSMARECDDGQVAFEVDSLDPGTRTGWSVLARGRAEFFRAPRPDPEGPDPWPAGTRSLTLVIDVRSLSGRRLLPG